MKFQQKYYFFTSHGNDIQLNMKIVFRVEPSQHGEHGLYYDGCRTIVARSCMHYNLQIQYIFHFRI